MMYLDVPQTRTSADDDSTTTMMIETTPPLRPRDPGPATVASPPPTPHKEQHPSHHHGGRPTNNNGLDAIRCHPEIMVRVYSFLGLADRIFRLSLVDRAFADDPVRAGVMCAHYGGDRLGVKEALDELERRERRGFLQPIALMRGLPGFSLDGGADNRRNEQQRMVGGRHPPNQSHWLVDIVADRTRALPTSWNGRFNQLSDLVETARASFAHDPAHAYNINLRSLYPGWTLHLPDSDSMWKMHGEETCRLCRLMTADCSQYKCCHGESEFCCSRCRRGRRLCVLTEADDPSSTSTDVAVVASCIECRMSGAALERAPPVRVPLVWPPVRVPPVLAPTRVRSLAVGLFPDRRHALASLISQVVIILPILFLWSTHKEGQHGSS